MYDVLIVGAGPVGLATALALRKRSVNNILVIDRTCSFRRVGQIVDILPNGLKALKYIDDRAYQSITATNPNFGQSQSQKSFWHTKNLRGEVVHSIPLYSDFWFSRYGEGRVSIPWYELQTHLRNLLPSETVQADRRCIDLAQETEFVRVECTSNNETGNNPFAHWQQPADDSPKSDRSESNPSYKEFSAKLVVAADGINSTIRRLIYANSDWERWAEPQYSGYAAIGCLQIENISDETMAQLENYFQGERVVTLIGDPLQSGEQYSSPRLILIHRAKNILGYLLHAPLELSLLKNKSPQAIVSLAADILKQAGFATVLSQLIERSNLERLFHRPYYIHPTNLSDSRSLWSNRRVVLVGDAAHGMPPFAAQGANQGLEDAAVIGSAIATIINNNKLNNLEIISQTFSKYEQLRRPFIEKIQAATMRNQSWSQPEWNRYSDTVYNRNIKDSIDNFICQTKNDNVKTIL